MNAGLALSARAVETKNGGGSSNKRSLGHDVRSLGLLVPLLHRGSVQAGMLKLCRLPTPFVCSMIVFVLRLILSDSNSMDQRIEKKRESQGLDTVAPSRRKAFDINKQKRRARHPGSRKEQKLSL